MIISLVIISVIFIYMTVMLIIKFIKPLFNKSNNVEQNNINN